MRQPIKQIATGIDVGTHSTRVVIMEQSKGGIPRVIGTGISETFGLRHGYVVGREDAIKSIKSAIIDAEKIAGIKVKNVLLSVGGVSLESMISHGYTTISRISGEVTEQDLKKIEDEAEENLTHTANKKIIYRTPLRYKLDNKEVLGSPCGMTGNKLEVKMFFATYLEHHLNDIVNIIENIGVEVYEVVPSPIAAGQVALTKKQRIVGSALVNIGAETVSIAVFENDLPSSLQVFQLGSTDITNDIAIGLKIPLEEAERMKIESSSNVHIKEKRSRVRPKNRLDEIIEARLCDIFELVESHLKKIGRNGLLPAGIILTGGGAGIATIEDIAKAVLNLPSSVARPALSNANRHSVKDSLWLVAYGLCLYGFNKPKESNDTNIDNIIETFKGWMKPFLP